jgi:hypothetical protein
MADIIQEFEGIDSEPALRAFLQKNGFRLADSRSHADQYVLGAFIGKIGGRPAKITHRLFEDSATQPARLGKNRVLLELDGGPSVEVRFHGSY